MNLMHNPEAYLAAQREVDNVIGTSAVTRDHLKQLPYLDAVFRETLRSTPTAPALNKAVPTSRHNEYVTICDGKYHVKNNDIVRLLLAKCMQDVSGLVRGRLATIRDKVLVSPLGLTGKAVSVHSCTGLSGVATI